MVRTQYPGSLHGHTEYSNLDIRDSTNRIEDLMTRAAIELGQEVIAFTEHETVCNAIKIEKVYKKIKEKKPDFKVIRGNEIYLVRNGLNKDNITADDSFYHFILLAKDAIGHHQIRELSTRAWGRSWRPGKITRRPTYYQDLIDIIGANPGHVIGSTACLGGFFAKKSLEWWDCKNNGAEEYALQLRNNIVGWVNRMIEVFGEGNFYLEMQPASSDDQKKVNQFILKLHDECGFPYIITCDEHYLTKNDRSVHKAFLNSQDAEREVDEFYETTYLMGTEELESYLKDYMLEEDIEEAYSNIRKIMNMCEDYSLIRPLKIPSLQWKQPTPISAERMEFYRNRIPYFNTFLNSDFNGDKVMIELIVNKLESDPRLQTEDSYKEINNNLEATWISSEVNKTHWSAYFLNLQRNIEVCWEAGTLVGPGRGSGVGFYILYLLDIIQINPMWETTRTYQWRLTLRV